MSKRSSPSSAETEAGIEATRTMLPSLGTRFIRAGWLGLAKRSHLQALLVVYLAVAIFVTGFMLLWWTTRDTVRPGFMPSLSRNEVLVLAVLFAAPVLVAGVWDRLSSVKVAGVEISLISATQPVETNISGDLQDTSKFVLGGSGLTQIKVAINSAYPLVQVNLGGAHKWWSTRLHLLGALTQDYTAVQHLLFVTDREGSKPYYLGIARPAAVRAAMARLHPQFEEQYRLARASVQLHSDPEQEVEAVLGRLNNAMSAGGMHEEAIKQFVTSSDLSVWLGGELMVSAVDWAGPEDALLRYLLVSERVPFVALVRGGQLERVVDRCDLATLIAKQVLSKMLGSSHS